MMLIKYFRHIQFYPELHGIVLTPNNVTRIKGRGTMTDIHSSSRCTFICLDIRAPHIPRKMPIPKSHSINLVILLKPDLLVEMIVLHCKNMINILRKLYINKMLLAYLLNFLCPLWLQTFSSTNLANDRCMSECLRQPDSTCYKDLQY